MWTFEFGEIWTFQLGGDTTDKKRLVCFIAAEMGFVEWLHNPRMLRHSTKPKRMVEDAQLSNSHYFFAFLDSKTEPRPHGIEKLFNPSSADYSLRTK